MDSLCNGGNDFLNNHLTSLEVFQEHAANVESPQKHDKNSKSMGIEQRDPPLLCLVQISKMEMHFRLV